MFDIQENYYITKRVNEQVPREMQLYRFQFIVEDYLEYLKMFCISRYFFYFQQLFHIIAVLMHHYQIVLVMEKRGPSNWSLD